MTPIVPVRGGGDTVDRMVRRLLDVTPTPLVWLPWEVDPNPPSLSARGSAGHRQHVLRELHLLGCDGVIGVERTLGAWAPDRSGQVLAPMPSGRRAARHLVEGCRSLLRELIAADVDMEPPLLASIHRAAIAFDKGTFVTDDFTAAIVALEVMGTLHEEGSLRTRHPWALDTGLFASDAAVFPSEAFDVDCLALTCEEGYALVGNAYVDRLFTFHGVVSSGRPRFSCEQATLRNRRAELKKKTSISRDDKIEIVAWITKTINQH